VSTELRVPLYAHWEGQEYRVPWSVHRPEPQRNDRVRLEIDADNGPEWRSFRVVDKRDRIGRGGQRLAIDLFVELMVEAL